MSCLITHITCPNGFSNAALSPYYSSEISHSSFTLLIKGLCRALNITFLVFLFLMLHLKAPSLFPGSEPLLPVETLWFCFPAAHSIKKGQICHSMDSFLCMRASQRLSIGSPMTSNTSANAAKSASQ